MRKLSLAALASLALVLGATASRGQEHHVKADLVSTGGSGITGFVELTQLPHGGTNIHVIAKGVTPGTVYASFYYESADCSEPADLLANFTGGDDGVSEVHGKIDDDLDEVGSVSVRLGPGYGTLLACATVH